MVEVQALSQLPSSHLNNSQIQKWKAFVQGYGEFKNLKQLHSYNDTANYRIPIKSDPYHVKQCRERDARHVNRSGAESMPLTNDNDTDPSSLAWDMQK